MPFPVPPAVEAELRRINAEVEAAFKAGDYARLVDALYHKDAKALPPGQQYSNERQSTHRGSLAARQLT